jgi:hypothetical protein
LTIAGFLIVNFSCLLDFDRELAAADADRRNFMSTPPASPGPASARASALGARHDAPFFLLGALAGMGAGWADVAINDLLFTALLVLAACMVLGLLRPLQPWRWVVAVGTFIPLTEFVAYLISTVKPTRVQIYGSLLASLPGIAGAYGGSLMRAAINNLRAGK